jgi:outer membrane protein assembly factor BamB
MPASSASSSSGSNSNSVTQLWSFTTDGSVYTSPIVADGCIYALSSFETGGSAGNIYCLNAFTGTQIWNFTVEGYVYSALAVSGGYVYTGSSHGKAYAFNASTGARVWNYTTENIAGPPTLTGPTATTVAPPVVSGSVVYFGSGRPVEPWGDIRGVNGTVHAFDALTSAQLWNYTTEYPVGYILAGNDVIYAVSAGGFGKNPDHPISSTIYALEPTSISSPFSLPIVIVAAVVAVMVILAVLLLFYRIRQKEQKVRHMLPRFLSPKRFDRASTLCWLLYKGEGVLPRQRYRFCFSTGVFRKH